MATVYDIFQPGLIRGSERLPFDPEKAYAYVEHPTEGWRVYLRSCAFVSVDKPWFNKRDFLVVKKPAQMRKVNHGNLLKVKWKVKILAQKDQF